MGSYNKIKELSYSKTYLIEDGCLRKKNIRELCVVKFHARFDEEKEVNAYDLQYTR